MNRYRIIITPRAGRDLEQIHTYIAQDSPGNADGMISRILAAVELFEQFPHRTVVEHRGPKLRHPVRSLPVPPYLIYFRVIDDQQVVRILHVRHGARRPPRKFD
jgi:plasmid stabilization system protein ParE